MEDRTRDNRVKIILVVSILLNILFASLATHFLLENNQMQDQIVDLSSSYNQIVLSMKSLEQQLNMTMTQLDYYKKLVESNSSQGSSNSFEGRLIGSATIPIVAVSEIRNLFQTEYEGVVMYADVELYEGSGRILVNTATKMGVDIQTSLKTASQVNNLLIRLSSII
ncbi:hypothetical protein KEJ47_04935 [Candidatus Bathyarchaeota archaeon]|nr:hypothetical protein [Candidatus Bathyarchaeota archaeon]